MKKQNFRKTWKTITELSKIFGISNVKFGKVLKEYKLRQESGEPTIFAIDNEYCYKVEPKDKPFYWLWNIKVKDYLIKEGFKQNETAISIKELNYSNKIKELVKQFFKADKMIEEGNDKLGFMCMDEIHGEIKDLKLTDEIFQKYLKILNIKEKLFLNEHLYIETKD